MIHFLRTTNSKMFRGTALLRLDFNTKDDWRMRAVLPTIQLLLKTSEKIVIISHRGRPQGGKIVNGIPVGFEKSLNLKRDAESLSRLLGKKIIFIPHFRFVEIKKIITTAPRGSIFLLENLRFLKGEEKNDASLARQLSTCADFYVNDAFAVSHRANTSIVAITKILPSYAGLEFEKEIISLGKVMKAPHRPLIFVIGGAKAADKLGIIQYFKNKADWFLLGGGSANTMLRLRGYDIQKSIADNDAGDKKDFKKISKYKKVILPQDCVWKGDAIFDIGVKTAQQFSTIISDAKTIIWSGPVGMTEKRAYEHGSASVARAIIKNRSAFSIVGGGETVAFLKKHGLDKKFSFISTGGGAMLDFLAGKKLPGIEALKKK